MKKLWLAAACLVMPVLAQAQSVTGLYVAAGAGVNLMPEAQTSQSVAESQPAGPGYAAFHHTDVAHFNRHFNTGAAAVMSAGYGLGNGLRAEVEGDYRYNDQNINGFRKAGNEQKYGAMVNALFDLDVGLPYAFPYVGAGIGFMHVQQPFLITSSNVFAYQAIAGVAMPIAFVPGLSATLEYRFMGLDNAKRSSSSSFGFASYAVTEKTSNDFNNAIMIGLRYTFGATVPPPPSSPVVAVPAPAAARTYLVFFDWDRADLTDRARQIIAEAAAASTYVQTTRIEVQGNADRSGTPAYNQGLSLRRAQIVVAELVRHGVSQATIDIQAFGDNQPLVPTAAGIRAPHNRRVAIILR